MSVTLTCTACGGRVDMAWLRGLNRGMPFVCPQCGRALVETGFVEVDDERPRPADENGHEEAA
jgi:uncharacterized protein (DUF983 family)